jgi:hypothetical protein
MRSQLMKLSGALRPSVLFAAAFALVTTPHEAAHAVTAYLLGFNLTLFKMWVNPDAASATPWQSFAIAIAGPIFSLMLALVSWMLYRTRFKERCSGLLFLMLTIVGMYSFLGPMAAAAFGGDFNTAFQALGVPRPIAYAVSVAGLVSLSAFMFAMGRELLGWGCPDDSRWKTVRMMTLGPWLLGMLLVLLMYWPLPKFMIGPNVLGSIFWVFAVAGASFSKAPPHRTNAGSALTLSDMIATILAISMILSTTSGIRMAR